MTLPRPVFFIFRSCFGFFIVLTFAYCLLTYIPFTYQQVHVGGLLPWLNAFRKFHPYFYWTALVVVALTVLDKLDDSKTKIATLGFLVFGAGTGIFLMIHPVLDGLGNNLRSVFWGLGGLIPLVWVAAIDWLGHGHEVQWSPSRGGEDLRVFQAGWESAFYLALIYAAIFYLRFQYTEKWVPDPRQWLFILTWSLTSYFLVFLALGVVASLVGGLADLFTQRTQADFAFSAIFAVILLGLVLRYVIFAPISFGGYLASMVAVIVASSIVLYYTGLCVQLYRPAEGPLEGGLTFLLAPTRLLGSLPGLLHAWFLLMIPGIAYYLGLRAALLDWEFLLQELCVLLIWTVTFATLFTITRPTETRWGFVLVSAACLLTLGGTLTLKIFQPRWELIVKGSQPNVAALLDEYADRDVSFRLARQVLSGRRLAARSASASSESFFSFIGENTNIPRSIPVKPADVKLVQNLRAGDHPKPNIFVFVIDSLRRDYLSPFNPSVNFTPSIAEFAQESVAFENSFTQYAGTGLSEPCIWTGALLVHQQYVTPFYPMNSLEKLVEAEKYQVLVSKDDILNAIMAPMTSLVELDKGRGVREYDFCRTLGELEGKIEQMSQPLAPLFVYTQPQNIHISVIDREGRSVLDGGKYPGFDPAYSSRVRRIDRCFGDFIQFLKKKGLFDNSIIILTSDHGDSLGERGRMGHAYTIFPEVIEVPLIIHLPPALASAVTFDPRAVAFLTDITPTLYYSLGHKPIARNDIFGRPLFTERLEEQTPYLRDSYLIVSSYGPVYGILSNSGHSLYIADGVNFQEYFFELGGGSEDTSKEVTDTLRGRYQQEIRERVDEINRFYKFQAPSAQ
jgi:hypothetical protein